MIRLLRNTDCDTPSVSTHIISVDSAIVVIVHIIRDPCDQLRATHKFLAVIPFSFNHSPKPFHRTIIDTFSNTRHTLCHFSFNDSFIKILMCILESTITMKERVRLRYLRLLDRRYQRRYSGHSYH